MKTVVVHYEGEDVRGEILGKGKKNWRVCLPNGETPLIPLRCVRTDTETTEMTEEHVRPVIPVTCMRKVYQVLREFAIDSFHTHWCNYFATEDGCHDMAKWFRKSVEVFDEYDNQNDKFNNRNGAKPPKTDDNALEIVRLIAEGKYAVGDTSLKPWKYIDYEVCPYRTTGRAVFAGGRTASRGTGTGIDGLFITTDESSRFVVAEVKATTDPASVFLGLVQTLTYVAEMVTKPQRSRLIRTYEELNPSARRASSNQMDVLIILERPIKPRNDKYIQRTLKIATQLLKDKRVNQDIQSFIFAGATLTKNESVILDVIGKCKESGLVKSSN